MRPILVQVTEPNDEQHENIAQFQYGPSPTRRARAALISLIFALQIFAQQRCRRFGWTDLDAPDVPERDIGRS
jgi:hypothetical protein